MLKSLKIAVRKLIKKSGWELIKTSVLQNTIHGIPADYEASHVDTYNKVKDYTMTTSQRIVAMCNAIDYLTVNDIDGDIVECGVWRGGSTMAAIDTLLKHKSTQRNIYLYDTFEGMPAPTSKYDIKKGGARGVGISAEELYNNSNADDFVWCNSPLDEVKQNLAKFDYPGDKIFYIKGKVEDTIPQTIPRKIALLRLDTNFYESTRHELEHLFPLIVPGGVILFSDYGDWAGARKAADEYISKHNIKILLTRIDNTGRIGVNTGF
ncbi:MAG: TylF/MycF family methyltransferase [Bacteroidota bacterium]|nr:TylF/MycF family methyltransferase [Bacteroidota bacterium]